MPTITTRDGTEIFYKDPGNGRAVVFIHGWLLNVDAWTSSCCSWPLMDSGLSPMTAAATVASPSGGTVGEHPPTVP